ncbi:E3 ubiquitin ligase [Phytophthora cinnamomi]|uniref:E3 ubiquitin ligase n=1 Tax=Phytophthora cinnamomi TaxID=4785 RepID=UPI003559802F|nr:E3 ubiquitin ligase [Phytophthora cinnamomi]
MPISEDLFPVPRRTPGASERHIRWFSTDNLRYHVQHELPLLVNTSSSSAEADAVIYNFTTSSAASKKSWSVSYRYSEFLDFKTKLDHQWTCHTINCSGSCQTLRDIVSALFPKKCLPAMSSTQLMTSSRRRKFEHVLTHLLRSVLLPGSVMKCLHARQHLLDNLFEVLGVDECADRRSVLQVFVDDYQVAESEEIEDNQGTSGGDAAPECMICLSDVDSGRDNLQRDSEDSGTDSSDSEVSGPSDSYGFQEGSGEDTTRTVLPCKHVFHRKCIFQWLLFEFHCPVCRTSLPPNAFTNYCCPRNYTAQWWLSDFAEDLSHAVEVTEK